MVSQQSTTSFTTPSLFCEPFYTTAPTAGGKESGPAVGSDWPPSPPSRRLLWRHRCHPPSARPTNRRPDDRDVAMSRCRTRLAVLRQRRWETNDLFVKSPVAQYSTIAASVDDSFWIKPLNNCCIQTIDLDLAIFFVLKHKRTYCFW